jgi:signal transduction histidine kinase
VPVPESGGTEVAELGRAFNAMARRVEAEELGRLRTERALLQAQKMESLGLAGSAIAHDFNNLLTVFSSAGETIERHAEEPKVRRMTRLIANTVTRGTALTNRLLGLARERPLELTIEDLRDVVLRMGEVLRRLIPESVDLRVEAGKVPCRARVDAHQIEQVVMNLVINARDALPNAEGRIDVRVDAIEVDATYARMIGGLHAGPHARLVVTDDGLGMSPEIARNAMEPLFTTKEPGTGTGLGLAIGELVARDHGGALTIDSAEGEGTIVTLLVPLASGEDAPQKDDPDGRVISRRLRVAVSEDDEHVRLAIVGALVDLGYEVYDFASGEQLLGWMGNHADLPVDLLITDVVMRGLSGPETAREVRGRGAACHVIYVSGYGHEELGNHGAVLLRKPFGRAQLAHAIAAACGENDLETQRS